MQPSMEIAQQHHTVIYINIPLHHIPHFRNGASWVIGPADLKERVCNKQSWSAGTASCLDLIYADEMGDSFNELIFGN